MKPLQPTTTSKPLAFVTALFLAMSAGCHGSRPQTEQAPPPQDVTPGSTFTVVTDFLIPDGVTSVYFQDTHLYPEGDVRPDYPFCQLTGGTSGEIIRSGVLTVGSVEYDEAGVGPNGTDVSVTKIHLREASTGKAYGLNCMLPVSSYGARFVTPVEIQGAVGGYMNLKDAP